MSSRNMRVALVMEMVDRFSGKTGKINAGFTSISRHGSRAMRTLQGATNKAYHGLDRLGNRYMAFLTGAGGAAALAGVVSMETRLTRLGIQASISADEIERLRKEVNKVANAKDIRIDPQEILNAVDTIVEKTGDLDLARNNIRNIGLAIQASGAAGTDIGAMVANLSQKFDLKDPDSIFQALDLLINQGKAGAFTLNNLASQGERVTAAYATTGRVLKPAVKEMGAMLQVIRQGTGSSEMAATAFEALMRTLSDAEKRKKISKTGVRLMDPDEPEKMRAITDIVKDLVKAVDGDVVKLSSIFDAEAIRALNAVAAEYKKTKGFGSLEGFLSQSSNGATLVADATRAASRTEAAGQSILTALKNSVFEQTAGPIKKIADIVGGINPDTLGKLTTAALGVVGALGIGVVGVKAHKFITGGRGRSAAGGLGGLARGAASIAPTPVIVLNWPGGAMSNLAGIGGGAGAAGAGAASRGARFARLGRMAKGAGVVGAAVSLGAGAYGIGSSLKNGDRAGLFNSVGDVGGGIAGMAAGAAIGSIVPVIGTAIGAAIGGIAGSYGGGKLGSFLAEKTAKVDTGGKLKIDIDASGLAKVTGAMNDKNTKIETGTIMGGAY